MGRVSQPVEVAKLKGADRKNPQRYRKQPARAGAPLGEPPDHLGDGAKEAWRELASMALPNVLTVTQRHMMEVLSTLYAAFRAAPLEFTASNHQIMMKYFVQLGFSVAARGPLGDDGKKAPGEASFDDF